MKKRTILSFCLIAVLSLSACSIKNGVQTQQPQKEEQKQQTSDTPQASEDKAPKERTAESDRAEIKNNIRDAAELIKNDCIDDALMIIKALESRELTDAEKEAVNKLKQQIDELK